MTEPKRYETAAALRAFAMSDRTPKAALDAIKTYTDIPADRQPIAAAELAKAGPEIDLMAGLAKDMAKIMGVPADEAMAAMLPTAAWIDDGAGTVTVSTTLALDDDEKIEVFRNTRKL